MDLLIFSNSKPPFLGPFAPNLLQKKNNFKADASKLMSGGLKISLLHEFKV